MERNAPRPPISRPAVAKELQYLRAQLAAVQALIRALEAYQRFYPRLVEKDTA